MRPRVWWLVLVAVLGCGPVGPVTFSDVRVEELTATRAVVRFSTNQPTTCEVQLGLAADVLDQHFTDPDMKPGQLATRHQVPLEDLTPAQTYFFRAKADDSAGTAWFSEVQQFTTPAGTATTLTNVALRANGTTVTSVSSNYGGADNDSAYGANKAIDGNFATEWSSNGDGNGARLELDLGQVRHLTSFGFRSRSMSDGTAIITHVGLSLDGATPLEFDTPDPTRLYVFELPAAVDARAAVIRALATTGGNTGAKEVQLLMP